MNWTIVSFLAAPFAASFILTGILAYLGVHVVERGVIFVDLALAQIAVLGATIALVLQNPASNPNTPPRVLGEPRLHVHRRRSLFDRADTQVAHPTGGAHRHLLRRGGRGVHPRHEQGAVRERAPQGHARREHSRGVVGAGVQDGFAVSRASASSTSSSGRQFLAISVNHEQAEATGLHVRWWDFLFYASFGFVVTSSVSIAGVLLVFCYLIVPSVAAMLYSDHIGTRLAIGWTMGTIVSAVGVYLSLKLDFPTGATIVCTFGVALLLMALARPLVMRRTA